MRERVGETWIDPEELAYPYGSLRRSRRKGYVRFPDGKLRRVTLGIHDTYWTIPAYGRVAGKYVGGFAMVEDGEFAFFPHPGIPFPRKAGT